MHWNLRSLLLKGSIIIFFFCCACDQRAQTPGDRGNIARDQVAESAAAVSGNPYPRIESIPVPAGYRRAAALPGSFGGWLRQLPLKKDRTVYLFDGSPKRNQDAQFAVLNISVGHKDLQQCADAVMRLRAEFLYAQKDFGSIDFYTGEGTRLNFREWAAGKRVRLSGGRLVAYTSGQTAGSGAQAGSMDGGSAGRVVQTGSAAALYADRACFASYLETVFSYCGTLSLEKQLVPVGAMDDMKIGDVLIRGGSPGHAMLVVDMAADSMGQKIYLLAQSYMPAQDIHIVNNPDGGQGRTAGGKTLGPWYRIDKNASAIETPEWTFYARQLRTWPGGR